MTGALVLTLAARAVRTITASDRYASWRGNAFDAVVEQNHGRPRADELEALPVRDAVDARGKGVAVVAGIVAIATVVVVGQLLDRQFRLSTAQARVLRSIGMTPR